MTGGLDRRLHAYRPDLADERLRGRVEAERFVEGRAARVTAPSAPVRAAPSADRAFDATYLMGEPVRLFEERADGWVWAQSEWDGYVGYARADAFGPPGPSLTHRVAVATAPLLTEPTLKSPTAAAAPLGAQLSVATEAIDDEAQWAALADGRFAHRNHIRPLDAPLRDWVSTAEKFLGAPYEWGGETPAGVDCSGVVHVALQCAGRACSRDSDMQEASVGAPIDVDGPLRRGDLVFWRGHVGVMLDAETLLHANAWHMLCVAESLSDARARIAASDGGETTGARRLD